MASRAWGIDLVFVYNFSIWYCNCFICVLYFAFHFMTSKSDYKVDRIKLSFANDVFL